MPRSPRSKKTAKESARRGSSGVRKSPEAASRKAGRKRTAAAHKKVAAKGVPRKDLDEVRSSLLERRRELLERMALVSSDPRDGEIAGPGDLADSAGASFQMDVTAGILKSETKELQEIDNALARIGDGTYGVCQDCERRIPATRLMAVPYATMCVQCKSDREKNRSRPPAPQRWQMAASVPFSLELDDKDEDDDDEEE